MAFSDLGNSYQPGAATNLRMDQGGGPASGVSPQQAVKFLSLRVPERPSPTSIAPLPLLMSKGGAAPGASGVANGGLNLFGFDGEPPDLAGLLNILISSFPSMASASNSGGSFTPRIIPITDNKKGGGVIGGTAGPGPQEPPVLGPGPSRPPQLPPMDFPPYSGQPDQGYAPLPLPPIPGNGFAGMPQPGLPQKGLATGQNYLESLL